MKRKDRELVNRVLRRFVRILRGVLKSRGPEIYARFPNARRPCHTCAFNPSTDNWKGWDSTAYDLMRAIARDQPFYCHEPFERTKDGWKFDPAKASLCGGWAAVYGDPAAKTAFMRAAIEEQTPEVGYSSCPDAPA